MRVGEDFVAGGGVERSAFGILDAWIEIERGFFGAARVVDAIRARQRINVFVIEVEIARELAQLRCVGNAAERVFRSDLRKLECGLHHTIEAGWGEIAGVGAGGTLPSEDSYADGARSGFFEGFDLAEADEGGEFIAFAGYALGSGGAAVHGAADDVLG